MRSFSYTVTDPVGIHARPAGDLVRVLKLFESAITISCNGKSGDAKKLMQVLQLGVKEGQEVTLCFEGPDEEKAALEAEAYMKEHL